MPPIFYNIYNKSNGAYYHGGNKHVGFDEVVFRLLLITGISNVIALCARTPIVITTVYSIVISVA